MKLSDVEIICSEKIDAEHLGIFNNSFHLTNYEWFIKDDKKPEKAHEDERMDRKSKVIDKVEISHEKGTTHDSYIKKMIMAEATHFSRNLANVRGSTAVPEYMEHQVRALCDQHKDLIKEVRVIQGQQLLDENMNLFHAVGRSADSEPRCVIVHYAGDPASKETTALVGKGITYDTGGLNLKGTGFMELMYGDKNGSCAIIGALHGVLASKPKLNIVFAMAFAENSIDSKSYKPGDIIKSRKGITVEIGNTDAEGRLVLCDTLTYVQDHFKPHTIVDLATLTGAIMIALGHETAGLFSNDDDLADALLKSGKDTFEPYWRMPILEEHREVMKSKFADVNNIGNTRMGGSCQAASYLERFIEDGVKWAHLDIAGPAMGGAQKGPICADGTGFGTQTLLDYLWKQTK